MATSVASSAIVLEVLRHDNYEDWKSCIQYYFLAQDLWDVVENHKNDGDDDLEWRKKNAAALHAIRISCSPKILSQIRDKNLAKEAWDFLARDKAIIISNQIGDYGIDAFPELMDAAKSGDWQSDNQIFTRPNISGMALCKALRVAIVNGRERFVKELFRIRPDIDLQLFNPLNVTALHSAAMTGSIKIAKHIVSKDGRLLVLEDDNGMIPVTLAAFVCDEKMTRYLYSETPAEVLTANEGIHGATLLTHWIATKHFDVALDLLQRKPELAPRRDKDGITPIYALARVPSAFRSVVKLLPLPEMIYDWIPARPRPFLNEFPTTIFDDHSLKSEQRVVPSSLMVVLCSSGISTKVSESGLVFSGLVLAIAVRILYELGISNVSGIEHFIMKPNYIRANELSQLLCNDIEKYGDAPRFIQETLVEAVSNGITELFDSIIEANPDLLWNLDMNQRNLFMLAIQYRQWGIFKLINYRFKEQRKSLASCVDSMGNNALHIAGLSTSYPQRQKIPGAAAIQMQRELLWFKVVEYIVHPKCKEARNSEGFTPRELFTENHKNMSKEGEKWMRQIATSATVVAALILTITFAGILTLPGGTYQDKNDTDIGPGFPIFLHRKLFVVFIVADSLSLVLSSASLLTFFEILTSDHAEDDFLFSLDMVVKGLYLLFFSSLAVVVASWAVLNLMKEGKIWLLLTSFIACLFVFRSWRTVIWFSTRGVLQNERRYGDFRELIVKFGMTYREIPSPYQIKLD